MSGAKRLSKSLNDDHAVEEDESDEPTTPSKVYATKQAAGKAIQRLRVKLPFSPRKRRAITLKLAIEAGNTSFESPSSKQRDNTIPTEVHEKVIEFYSRDDISWAAPGKRDSSIVRAVVGQKTSKKCVQNRFMTMNIMEAHQIFKKENPEIQIGKSKFFEFRPKGIKPMADIPHNVCICQIHGNMDSLLSGIAKACPLSPRSGRDLLEALVCKRQDAACMLGTCEKCSDAKFRVESSMDEDDNGEERCIKWKRWEEVTGRPTQVEISMSLSDAVDRVNALLSNYKTHCYIKDEQSNFFKSFKNQIRPSEAVLQIDFAENYACISQDEVQSAHWNHKQVTLFTAVAWMGNSECKSFVIVSDDLDHDKHAVWSMLKVILKRLTDIRPIETVVIFSDGCAAQFKNRYTMANLCFADEDFGVTVEWAFFASSHGKGSVDAIGGTVKRSVWRAVKARKIIVNDSQAFFKVGSNLAFPWMHLPMTVATSYYLINFTYSFI